MTETTVPAAPEHEFAENDDDLQARLAILNGNVAQYDPASDEASFLRHHQAQAVDNYRDRVARITNGELPNRGMAILHPTGSGKTVTTAEILRLSIDPGTNGDRPTALMLVPGHSIMAQTVGGEDEVGAINRFAPNVQVSEYSGRSKSIDGDVVVMTYQSLPWAMRRGDIDRLDPSLVICDEAHHVIDGTWAKTVAELAQDRVLIGLTATPTYSSSRDISKLFPDVLDQKTMREGIQEGILSELQGFVYKGSSRIELQRKLGGDYDQEGLFEALYKSRDNYMAAKICAAEVAMGRRGVVSCVPGFDRAHAKIMAEILNNTPVQTPDGARNIRAAYLDGSLPKEEVDAILAKYRNGQLDVLTYVNLLLEGWDSPESDFTVLLRPTKSRVLAEQRLGRIVRSREGKVATVHEFMYEMQGDNDAQITHIDVMGEEVVVQGHSYAVAPEKAREYRKRQAAKGSTGSFSIDRLRLDPELASRIDEIDAVPLEELRIACGQEPIPINWLTSGYLARRFNITSAEVETVLSEASIIPRIEPVGDIVHSYYPPKATLAVAEHLGIEKMPEGYLTLLELIRLQHANSIRRGLGRAALLRSLNEENLVPKTYIRDDGQVVDAYPAEAANIVPFSESMTVPLRPRKPQANGRRKPEIVLRPTSDAIDWLRDTLVSPRSLPTGSEQYRVTQDQKKLLAAVRSLGNQDAAGIRALHAEITELGLEFDASILAAARAQNVPPIGIVYAARNVISA